MGYRQVKERAYGVLEHYDDGDRLANAVNLFIIVLIIANVAAIVMETVENFHSAYAPLFHIFEVFSVLAFTAEYALRLWASTTSPRFAHPLSGRLRYALTPYALVDLFAFLPFYLPMVFPFDLRVLRMLRLLRLARLFKLARYSDALKTLGNIVNDKKEDILIALFIGAVLLVIASTLMYYAEHDAQPDKFASIPDAMWWGVITLATIGYGDIFPITPLGKLIGVFTAIVGIGMFALPAGILGSAFVEEMQKKHAKRVCPHCGKALEEKPEKPVIQEIRIKK